MLLSKTSFPSELHERRSVLERLLRARLVYSRAAMARALSFEYLNRQLVWHELSELLLFLLPLVNVGRLKAAVMARLPRLGPPVAPAGVATGMALSCLGLGYCIAGLWRVLPSPGPPVSPLRVSGTALIS